MIVLKLCVMLLVATPHSSAATLDDFPCELRQEIWSYLQTNDRHQIRELGHQASASDIEQMYLQECMKRRALYELAMFIRNATDIVSPAAFKLYLKQHRVKELMGNASDWSRADMQLLEEIGTEIALRYHKTSQQWMTAFNRHFNIRRDTFRGFMNLPVLLRFDTLDWSYHVSALFDLGMWKMKRTACKCNRYTRIALDELDCQLLRIAQQSSVGVGVGVGIADCWSALVDYRLIPDFMEREQLRKHESKSVYITQTVMEGATSNDTYLNTDALYMLVRYRNENVMDMFTMLSMVGDECCHIPQSRDLLSFVVDHGLKNWSEIYQVAAMGIGVDLSLAVLDFVTRQAMKEQMKTLQSDKPDKNRRRNGSNPLSRQRKLTNIREIDKYSRVPRCCSIM